MTIRKSGEDYLEAVLILQRKNGYVRSLDVAEYIGVSKPSVSTAVKLLRDGGFLAVNGEKLLSLTELGREVAEKIYERHCILTELLIFTGVSPDIAEEDACKIEHDLSEESFRRIKAYWEAEVKGK